MKVNSNITFQGLYTNKTFKKGLEFAAENGTLFSAATMLACSLGVRPLSIWMTPHVDKESKKALCAKSITSSFAGYVMMFGISKPVANSIKKIDENPQKYLSAKTIQNLKEESATLQNSKAYSFATQMFKLGVGVVSAIPKALLTVAGLPVVIKKAFPKKQEEKKQQNINFKGKNDKIAKSIAKTIEKEGVQNFSKKHKDSNFPMHIVALTDLLTTATFIHETNRSKKIEETRKKTLVYNATISTGLSILSSYVIDKLLEKPTEKFIENFRKANKGLPNVEKQVEGIKIAKPMLIMAGIYYALIPFISTFITEKAEHSNKFSFGKN